MILNKLRITFFFSLNGDHDFPMIQKKTSPNKITCKLLENEQTAV